MEESKAILSKLIPLIEEINKELENMCKDKDKYKDELVITTDLSLIFNYAKEMAELKIKESSSEN